jgi:succinylglutamate desuccinylase
VVSESLLDPQPPPVSAQSPGIHVPRVLGHVSGAHGPTLVAIGALHGNEPAGALALARIFARLAGHDSRVRGEVVGLAGNVRALSRNQRYRREDLNRNWLPERLARVRTSGATLDEEDAELSAIDHEVASALARRRGDVVILDLHCMSADGPAFVTFDDTLANRALALRVPSACVLGLEEELHGTLTDYYVRAGLTAFGFEAGQLYDPRSVDRAEAAVWIVLEAMGILAPAEWPEVERSRRLLAADRGGVPPVLEVRHRHPVTPAQDFRMHPGYTSLQPIRAGEPLAVNASGPVVAPFGGLILMPLYQGQGSDGFFIVRPVSRLWLAVSTVVRRLTLRGILTWLPGVSRHETEPGSFVVDTRRARWLAPQLFHLLGFKRRRRLPHGLVMEPRER